MKIEATPHTIRAIWQGLSVPCHPAPDCTIAALVGRLIAQGWATAHQVDETLGAFGVPLAIRMALQSPHTWLPVRAGCFRPAAQDTSAALHDFVAVADLAALLIRLEWLGLAIDPRPIVDLLRPALIRRRVISSGELRVVWYRRERHRSEPLDLVAPGYRVFFLERPVRLATGFRAIPEHQDGTIVALRVVPPGQRCHRPASELPRGSANSTGAAHGAVTRQPSGSQDACEGFAHGGAHAF